MAIEVIQLENQLMKSNCFILIDWNSKSCVIIDPASEKSEREISYIEEHSLFLDYIMLTHEHTDHTWGVNALKKKYPSAKLVCSELCEKYAKKASRAYFLFYFNDKNYRYELFPADVIIKEHEEAIVWHAYKFYYLQTPGHSFGSMCIGIENMLFTGDTIMPYPAYFNRRDSNKKEWEESIKNVVNFFSREINIYPGHGDKLKLYDWMMLYYK